MRAHVERAVEEMDAGRGDRLAGDLFRMYERFAALQGWKVEVISASEGTMGGYKEIISRIVGRGAFSHFKFESGTHRVQRVPATESQGRIHTSTCTVAVLPEIAEVESVEINPADLRVDVYRASGAARGGRTMKRLHGDSRRNSRSVSADSCSGLGSCAGSRRMRTAAS